MVGFRWRPSIRMKLSPWLFAAPGYRRRPWPRILPSAPSNQPSRILVIPASSLDVNLLDAQQRPFLGHTRVSLIHENDPQVQYSGNTRSGSLSFATIPDGEYRLSWFGEMHPYWWRGGSHDSHTAGRANQCVMSHSKNTRAIEL